jgi:hypothetical protein
MSSSNIRVFVQWKNATVFAGEDVECTITFKNIALPEGRDRSPARKQNGLASGGERQRKLPPVHSSTRPSVSRNSSYASQKPAPPLRGHRPALSLNTPSTAGDRRSPVPLNGVVGNNTSGQKHGRSLSIMSIGTDGATETSRDRGAVPVRPVRGHARSGSLQIVPGRPNPYPGMLGCDWHASKLTGSSQFTGPSLSYTPFPTRRRIVITVGYSRQLERVRISRPAWQETTRHYDCTEYSTCSKHNTKSFQFLLTNLQIPCRASE